MRLAIARWAKCARLVGTIQPRMVAACVYDAGEHAEAVRLQRGILDVETRVYGAEHLNILIAASNAVSLLDLGECAEAAVFLRLAFAVRTRTLRADDNMTFTAEYLLVNALLRLGEYAEAETLGRGALEKMRRVFGREHNETLVMSGNLAVSLSAQGKYAEAAEIEREVLVSSTRLLGAEHESSLTSATNLACSLWRRGQKTESEQLFRDALVQWICVGASSVRLTRKCSVRRFAACVRLVSLRDGRPGYQWGGGSRN